MGDRCHLRIAIHGPILTLRALTSIAKAIEDENLYPDYTSQSGFNAVVDELATDDGLPMFSADEVNYANIDDLEAVLQELKVAYAVNHDAGGSYSAGCWSWSPEYSKCEATSDGSEPVLAVTALEHAINEGGLDGVKELIAEAWHADGKGLPEKLVFSDKVERYLAKRAAAKALKLKGAA
jgi:hypothetical protein